MGRLRAWLLGVLLLGPSAAPAEWRSLGPFGGDARSLAADPANPDRMYLGTGTGQLYLSEDGGGSWRRLEALQAPTDWVVDNLVVDPAQPEVVYAAMYSLGTGGGGIFKTSDGGITWTLLEGMRGQSVRALALAPSNPQILVAGTLEGVFRSRDAGRSWQRISPAGHAEIHSVESVAIDPANPEIVYAGTWHLPWKTTDGGAHWTSIKTGMIDDSDVFSIVIDPTRPSRIYATACTGIYRSDNGGKQWRRIQGIPNSSRRTHTLALDPRHPETLYAGTTEGLWRTPDGGASWHRLTSHTWIINGILLDPRNPERFLIALDRAGVMETLDGGKSYRSANQGFVQRRISRMIADPADEDRLYISLLHDKEFGGVFTTTARQTTWQQLSAGLQGHDVLSLLIVTQPEWRLLAGTTEGVYEYSPQRPVWKNLGRWAGGAGNHGSGRGPVVRDLFQRAPQERLYAATSAGLFESSDGRDWRRLPLEVADGGLYAVASLGAQGEILLAASSSRLYRSADRGRSWREVPWEGNQPVRIHRIAPHPETPAEAYAATETGLYRSVDGGQSWAKKARGLPHTSFYDVQFVSASPLQILAAGASGAYRSQDGGEWFFRIGSGALSDGLSSGISAMQLIGHSEIVAASLVNGLFLQLPTEYTLPRELPSKE